MSIFLAARKAEDAVYDAVAVFLAGWYVQGIDVGDGMGEVDDLLLGEMSADALEDIVRSMRL